MTPAALTPDLLRPEQQEIRRLMHEYLALMIVSTMASGKTAAALTALREMLDTFELRRVLVVAPLRVARDTWPNEIRRWTHTRLLSTAVAVGTPKERAAAVDSGAEITIINFENLVWLYKHLGGARRWPFDGLVIDESSLLKAGRARTRTTRRKDAKGQVKVTKGGNLTRFGALARVRHKIDRVVALTGTPGDEYKLWGQMYLLDQGKRLGETKTKFEEKWFDKNPYSHEIKPREGAEAEIRSRISDIMFTIPPPKDLPEPRYVPVRVDLPPAALEEYARFKRTLVSEIHDVEAVSKGVLTQKLLQFSNGSMYREDRSVAKIHDAKLQALEDLVTRAAGDPMLVLYGFRFDLDEIRRLYPKAVVMSETKDFEKRWNDGKIKVGLAHPASCAHGLNLQFGGHLGVWFGFTWSLELYQQANARLPRPGQKYPVAMYQIIANGTDDSRLLSVLDDRDATQEDLKKATIRAIRTCDDG